MAFPTPDNGPYSPALDGFAITPNDSADLARLARAIHVGVGGDIVVDTFAGTQLTIKNVPSGTRLDSFYVARVYATNTTATDLIGVP
jgi:hypothetical protein